MLSTVLLRNTIYQTHPLYQTSGLKLRKKKAFHTFISAGNRNPVSRLTGGDLHHYSTEELDLLCLMDYVMGKHPISFKVNYVSLNYDRQTYPFFL